MAHFRWNKAYSSAWRQRIVRQIAPQVSGNTNATTTSTHSQEDNSGSGQINLQISRRQAMLVDGEETVGQDKRAKRRKLVNDAGDGGVWLFFFFLR